MASDNTNIPFPSFLTIPGAVRIAGYDTSFEFLLYDPPGHPIFKAPEIPGYIAPSNINIPLINFSDVVNLLDGILASIGKLEIKKMHDWLYVIEYHPVYGIKINSQDRLHKVKKINMYKAAAIASKKFQHGIDETLDENILWYNAKEWFQMELRIFYDAPRNCYLIEFNRMSGEPIAFYDVFREIKAQIEEILTTEGLWLMRKSYLYLLEGTKVNIHDETPTTRYLLNELLVREICSYNGI